MNIAVLLCLCFFIYALAGMNLFGHTPDGVRFLISFVHTKMSIRYTWIIGRCLLSSQSNIPKDSFNNTLLGLAIIVVVVNHIPIKKTKVLLGRHMNFRSFPRTILTLYYLGTGELWNTLLYDVYLPRVITHIVACCCRIYFYLKTLIICIQVPQAYRDRNDSRTSSHKKQHSAMIGMFSGTQLERNDVHGVSRSAVVKRGPTMLSRGLLEIEKFPGRTLLH